MVRKLTLELLALLLVGCHAPKTPSTDPDDGPALSAATRPFKGQTTQFDNARLKRNELGDSPISGDDNYRTVDGMWIPESSDPTKNLLFREQVRITCARQSPMPVCHFITVPLGVTHDLISIMDMEEGDWPVSAWDKRGLMAYNSPDDSNYGTLADRCHSHVLTMTFATGAVSTSDIPTHTKGCEAFKETNSYRLTQGNYYVDTTPANDADKPNPAK